MNFQEYLKDAAEQFGVVLTEKMIRQFDLYFQLLVEWNEKINLTAITEPREVAIKHMIDSLSCWDDRYFPPGAAVIDVGTGAGFPGIPLKIFRPDIKLTLLDSLNKRIKFLQEVADKLELDQVQCVHLRAEEGARQPLLREKFDVAVSRAVARLSVLAEYCMPFVKVDGYFVALKGMKYQEEVSEGANAVKVLGGSSIRSVPVRLPYIEDKRAVLYIRKVRATPKAYPRKAGTPDKNPL